jgi:hypothetical protein
MVSLGFLKPWEHKGFTAKGPLKISGFPYAFPSIFGKKAYG